jgi:cytochrome c2
VRALLGGSILAAAALLAAGCDNGGVVKGGDTSTGKTLFTQKCASCHTLADAGATGKIGPNLDDAFASDRLQGIKQSTIQQVVIDQIRDAALPMPANLVTGADAQAVSAYVASVAGLPVQGGVTAAPAPAPAPSTAPASPETTTPPSTEAASTATAPSTTGAAPSAGDAAKGKALFASLGCQGCHSIDGSKSVGPTFKGLAGSQVKLSNGQTVTADDAYLLDSIENPDHDIVSGFQPGIMSSTIKPGLVSMADAQALIAYLETLK